MRKSVKEINKSIKRVESSINALGPHVDSKSKDRIVKAITSLIEMNTRDVEKSKPKGKPGYKFSLERTENFPIRAWLKQYDVGEDSMYSLSLTKKIAEEYVLKLSGQTIQVKSGPEPVYISQKTLEAIAEDERFKNTSLVAVIGWPGSRANSSKYA